jgi:hypothetical protein
MEHETGSGWTGSPAHVSDDANGGNEVSGRNKVGSGNGAADLDEAEGGSGVGSGNRADNPAEAKGGNEAGRNGAANPDQANGGNGATGESAPSPTGSTELADDRAPAPAEAGDLAAPATGEPRVDAALRLLERLPGLPVAEHSQLFEQVHAQLSEVLGELDSGPGAGPGAR